jgi:hypothetical protein
MRGSLRQRQMCVNEAGDRSWAERARADRSWRARNKCLELPMLRLEGYDRHCCWCPTGCLPFQTRLKVTSLLPQLRAGYRHFGLYLRPLASRLPPSRCFTLSMMESWLDQRTLSAAPWACSLFP